MEQFTKDKKRTAGGTVVFGSQFVCVPLYYDHAGQSGSKNHSVKLYGYGYGPFKMIRHAKKIRRQHSIMVRKRTSIRIILRILGSSLIGIDEQEFDYLNNSLEHPINKGDFRSGKACIVYRNGLDLADADIIGKNVTCALYEDQQTTKTFTIEGITDENYYTALLGYPPTIIACDQVVKTFANHPITLKTSIKYHKEYDRDTEQEILALLEENDNAKDFSWEPKIEDADEIEKAQGNMPQLGISLLVCTMVPVLTWIVLEKNGTVVERIKGVE